MKTLLLKLEPVIWVMFGQGILIGTLLLTAWLLVVGVGIPIGLIPPGGIEFERAHALGSSLIGRVILAALIALPLWKGAHHTRHLFLDAGGHDRDAVVAPLLYGIATAGGLLAIVAVIRI
jgi:fumarate reductase subunit D